jgi:hypothetical protein
MTKIKQLNLKLLIPILILGIALLVRFWKVATLLPPYWEEVALGYDAFSISQTLKDHHGNFLPLVAFESFGDWKPSGYFYVASVFTKFLGLSVLAVRLPSVLAGVMIVLGVGVLAWQIQKSLLPKIKLGKYFPVLSMLVAAFNPWAIIFSRAAWEVNLATAFLLWGVISFFQFLKQTSKNFSKQLIYLVGSVILLTASMYTYHATRMIAPLLALGLGLMWFNFKKPIQFLQKNLKLIVPAGILGLILVTPILLSLTNKNVTQRFAETSILSDPQVVTLSNQLRETQPGIIGKLTSHRYVLGSRVLLENYLTHFNFNFLFVSGDTNPRHSTQFTGLFYLSDALFILLGIGLIFANFKNKKLRFLLYWLIIGIVPAALTKATPHALRILPTLPVWIILISLGIDLIFRKFNKWHLSTLIIGGVYLGHFLMFWNFYTQVYPQKYSSEWQYGYQQLMEFIGQDQFKNQTVYITREQGRPAMYYWFYNQTDPNLVQNTEQTTKKDQSEFLEFQNLKFVNSVNEVQNLPAIIATSEQHPSFEKYKNVDQLLKVDLPNGKNVWQVNLIDN